MDNGVRSHAEGQRGKGDETLRKGDLVPETVGDVSDPEADAMAATEAAFQSLPPGVALSWGFEKEPKRGPKRELSVDEIVRAAIKMCR